MKNAISFDITRGVDVMRGKKVIEHHDGPLAYERAKLGADAIRGGYIRYWQKKEAAE